MLNTNSCKIFFVAILVFCASFHLQAQNIHIDAHNRPLNEIFFELRDSYGVQFSFNDKLLADCIINSKASYPSPEKAISSLIKNCNLSYKIQDSVFIIYRSPERRAVSRRKTEIFRFSGQITDKLDGEPLPFSNILINSSGLVADVSGNFSCRSQDSVIHVTASYVGYYSLDTTLSKGVNQKISLTPSITGLREVIVKPDAEISKIHIGDKPGLIKLNYNITPFLPGNNDNIVFNLLRLQPGVMAAGEQSKDYMIWGSYKGQTLILFDGITLFNISGFNDNIGAVNPLLVKDIEVMKGGYNVNNGNRVGGIVNITGKSGDPDKFSANLNINNQTASGIVSIPFAGKYSLQTSFRHTYYNLYDLPERSKTSDRDRYTSDYVFRDLNIKFSGRSDNGDDYFISLMGSNDIFQNQYNEVKDGRIHSSWNEITKQQAGGALFYSKNWKKAGITNTSVSYSEYEVSSNDSSSYKSSSYTNNSISELNVRSDHYFPSVNRHSFSMGLGFAHNASGFRQDTTNITRKNTTVEAYRLNCYLKDNITLSEKINIQPGLRLDVPANTYKPYLQPRVNATIKPSGRWRINLACGIYNQFITESTIIDDLGNFIYHWNICDNIFIPVLKGIHYVTGIAYNNKGFSYSAEGFCRTTAGLSRFISDAETNDLLLHKGQSKSYGVDLYVKKRIKNHDLWIAYTLSKTEEHFSYFTSEEFQLAPHDQRHEIKGATLFNFDPYFLSLNYVYGSGLVNSNPDKIIPYNRLDIAFLYKFNTKKIKLETGLSVLNVMNSKNVRYNNFFNFPDNKTIYSEAMPFTPTLFLNIGF